MGSANLCALVAMSSCVTNLDDHSTLYIHTQSQSYYNTTQLQSCVFYLHIYSVCDGYACIYAWNVYCL